ncbi:hypothetical protein AtEden1_Chr4g0279561 [Arabidopsis thaliana]
MESTMSAQVTSLLVANFSEMCTSNGQSTKTRYKLMVLYIIKWRDVNHGSCQSQKKSIFSTCRDGSSPLGDKVYDWCRQPRCSFSYKLFFLQTVQIWWRWCLPQPNSRLSQRIWRSYRATRMSSQAFLYL